MEAAGSGEGLDVRFEGQGRVQGDPKALDLWDWVKCGAINSDRSVKGVEREGGKTMISVSSMLSLRRREEKEDMADSHPGILESRELTSRPER